MKIKTIAVCCFAVVLFAAAGCDFNLNEKDKHQAANDLIISNEAFDSPMDSLEYLVKNVKLPVSEIIRICDLLSWNMMYIDLEKAKYYAELGLDLLKSAKNDSITGALYSNLGMFYTFKQQYDTAKIYFDHALVYALETKDENLESFLYNAYAKLYGDQRNYKPSIEYLEKAMRLSEKIGNYDRFATITFNIGVTYRVTDNDEQAEKYLLKAIEIIHTKVDEPSDTELSRVYRVLSLIYSAQKRDEEAYDMFQKALNYAQLANSKYDEANALITGASIYSEYKHDYHKSLEMVNRALELAEELDIMSLKADCLQILGMCYRYLENYSASKMYLLQSLDLITADDLQRRKNVLKDYIYTLLMAEDEAKSAFLAYDSLMVAMNNQEVQFAISDLEIRYETEKKELKITSLEQEKRFILWLGITGSIVLLLALATFSFLWRWTVQKKRTVEQQKRLAEQQIKQLEQEKQLVATQSVLDGETRERARLARDLHDGLGSMLTGVKLNLLELKQGATLEYVEVERFDKTLGLLDSSVQEMRRVAHHLMPDSLSRFGLKPAVSDFCTKLASVRFAYYGDESRIDPNMEMMIYRSIHELVNNALKHAGADHIMVQIIQEPDRIAFAVQDDGCGFDPAAATEGVGLQNIRTRVDSYNGILDIDSKVGAGTEVNVELKISQPTKSEKVKSE